jgi:OOP family OmpA-OmpF porin
MGPGTHWTRFWLAFTGALFVAVFAMFGPHPFSIGAIEANLERQVTRAVAATGAALDVEMHGQAVRLEGVVTSDEIRMRAREAAFRAAGPGNLYLGAVTTVDADRVVVARKAAPFVWTATLTPRFIRLDGHVPSAKARARALEAATVRFNGSEREIVDEMIYAVGAPKGPWEEVVASATAQLSKLNFGEAQLEDNRLSILGEGDQASVAAIRDFYAKGPPAPFELVSLDLVVEGEGLGIEELQGMSLAQPEADDCQGAFTVLMRRNEIIFLSGSAAIDPESRAILNSLAKVARRCDQFNIQISGHTDDVGDPAANIILSQRRAEAVRDYLGRQGVSSSRLTAQGFGESRPVLPNTNEANRARNRRIVFEVS